MKSPRQLRRAGRAQRGKRRTAHHIESELIRRRTLSDEGQPGRFEPAVTKLFHRRLWHPPGRQQACAGHVAGCSGWPPSPARTTWTPMSSKLLRGGAPAQEMTAPDRPADHQRDLLLPRAAALQRPGRPPAAGATPRPGVQRVERVPARRARRPTALPCCWPSSCRTPWQVIGTDLSHARWWTPRAVACTRWSAPAWCRRTTSSASA